MGFPPEQKGPAAAHVQDTIQGHKHLLKLASQFADMHYQSMAEASERNIASAKVLDLCFQHFHSSLSTKDLKE